jgi:hypothetical protein
MKASDFVVVDYKGLPESLKLDVLFEMLNGISELLTRQGATMSDIKRESGETGAKIDQLLNEVGNTVNRLLAINAEKDTVIAQLQAGEIDATQAAAEQDALQTRMDDEITKLKAIGVTNIEEPPTA